MPCLFQSPKSVLVGSFIGGADGIAFPEVPRPHLPSTPNSMPFSWVHSIHMSTAQPPLAPVYSSLPARLWRTLSTSPHTVRRFPASHVEVTWKYSRHLAEGLFATAARLDVQPGLPSAPIKGTCIPGYRGGGPDWWVWTQMRFDVSSGGCGGAGGDRQRFPFREEGANNRRMDVGKHHAACRPGGSLVSLSFHISEMRFSRE